MIRMVLDEALQRGDLKREVVQGGKSNYLQDRDLETAVLISLFTEARVEKRELKLFYPRLPAVGTYQGGFWGDSFLDSSWGSKLWLLRAAKATSTNLNRARTYAEEALQWLIDEGAARSVLVEAERGRDPSWLRLTVNIARPDNSTWDHVWEKLFDDL